MAAIQAVANCNYFQNFEKIEAPGGNGQNWWSGSWDVKSNSCYIQTPNADAEHAYVGVFVGAALELNYRFKVWDIWYANQETDSSLTGLINGATIRIGDNPSPWLNPQGPTIWNTGLYFSGGWEGKYIFLYKNVAGLADKRLVVCALRAFSAKHNFQNRPTTGDYSSTYCRLPASLNALYYIQNHQYGQKKQTLCDYGVIGSYPTTYIEGGVSKTAGPQWERYNTNISLSSTYVTSVLLIYSPCDTAGGSTVTLQEIQTDSELCSAPRVYDTSTRRVFTNTGGISGETIMETSPIWYARLNIRLSNPVQMQGALIYSFSAVCDPQSYGNAGQFTFTIGANPSPVTDIRYVGFNVEIPAHQVGCPYVYRVVMVQNGQFLPAPDWLYYSSGSVTILCDSRTVAGTYELYLQITSLTEHGGQSAFRKYFGWLLTVSPTITGIKFASSEVTIALAPGGNGSYTVPTVSLLPTQTTGAMIYWSATGQPSLPSFFAFNPAATNLAGIKDFYFTAATSGTWTITIKAELDQTEFGHKAYYTINLAVYNCEFTSMVLDPYSLTVSVLGPSASTAVTYAFNYAACGAATILIDANYTDLLSVNSGNVVASAPQGYATGTITATITLSLNQTPSIQTSQQLTVIVTPCVVTGLTLNIEASTSVQVGIDPQPVNIPFSGTLTPACGYAITFSLTTTPPQFVTFDTLVGQIVVSGALKTDHSTNQFTLEAAVDGQTSTKTFEIIIIDRCSTTTFESVPTPLADMAIQLPSSSVLTQNVKIWTALERTHSSLICPITAVFSPSNSYITLSSDLTTISIDGPGLTGAIPSSVQIYAFTLTVNSKDFPTSVAEQSYSISVVVTCVVQSIAFTTTPAALTRVFVGVDTQPLSVNFALAMTPACPTSPTITTTQLPAFIRQLTNPDTTSGYLKVDSATLADVSTTEITLSIQSGLGSASETFQIEIVDPCGETTFVTDPTPIPATIPVQLASSVQRTIPVKVVTFAEQTTPTIICPITATLTPTQDFVLLAADFSSITIDEALLTSGIPNSVQNYPFTLVVNSLDYPQVPQVSISFTIEVTCLITAITFDSPQTTTLMTVGIGPQTQSFTFSVLATPTCPTQVSFTNSQSLPFLTMQAQSIYSFSLSLQDVTVTHHGTYSIDLTGIADSISATTSFSIEIIDPCSTTTFESVPPPLFDMAIELPSSSVLTQNVKIWTALERTHSSLICPITAVFSPPNSHITLSSDLTTISVDGPGLTGTIPASVQTIVFTLTVNSRDFPTSVLEQSYSISVVVTCVVQSIAFITAPASLTRVFVGVDLQPYLINFGLEMTPNCPINPVITTTSLPAFISLVINPDTTSGYFKVDQATLANVSTTDVTLSVSADLGSASPSFQIEIVDPCSETTFVTDPSPIQATIIVQLASSAQTTIQVKVLTAVEQTTPTVICPITAILTPSQDFISMAPDLASITIDEALLTAHIPDSVQNYSFTFVVNSLDYPQVPQILISFTIEVTCLITAITFDSPETSTTLTIGIGHQTQSFTFSVLATPSCPTQVSFTNSQTLPFLTMQTQSLYSFSLSIQDATVAQHDTYSISLTAAVDSSSVTASFSITIFDPCSNTSFEMIPAPLTDMPVMLVSSSLQNQVIKIFTAIERQYSNVICPVLVDLTPTLPFIILSNDFTLITVDESVLTSQIPSSVQTYQFTVTVNHSAAYATQLPQVQYTFNVVVSCRVEQVRLVSKNISDQTIEINPEALLPLVLPFPDYEVLPCLSSKPHMREVQMITPGPLPAFMSFSDINHSVSVQFTDPYTTGSYEFKVIATEPTSGIFNDEVVFVITFTCSTTSFSNSVKNVSRLNYVIPFDLMSVVSSMPMPVYATTPVHCLITPVDFKLFVTSAETRKSNEIFVWNDQSFIWVQAFNPASSGNYLVTIQATGTRFGFIDSSVQFNLSISCEITNLQPVYTLDTVFELDYQIGGGMATLRLPRYQWTPSTCEKQLEYLLRNDSGDKLLPFMQVDYEKMLVTLNGNFEHASYADKQYRFRFFAQTNDGKVKNSDYSFLIHTTFKNSTQAFVVTIPWDQSKSNATLNQTDLENKTDISNQIDVQNQTDLNETGSSNSTGNSNSTSPNATRVNLTEATTSNFTATDSQQDSNKVENDTDPADYDIPKVLVNASMPAFATKRIEKMPVRLPIKPKMATGPDAPLEVQLTGKEFGTGVLIEFNAPIDFRDFKDPTSIFEVILEPFQEMDRRLQASGNDPAGDSIAFSWSIEKVSQTEIKLNVHIDKPYDVSTGSTIHVIRVMVRSNTIKSTSGKRLAENQSFSMKLSSQMREEDVQVVQAATEVTSELTLGTMLGSFLVSILVMQALNLLFGMVGSLQFIMYMAILNVNFPGNANALFNQLFKIMCFDIIPDSVMKSWYDLVSKNTEVEDVSDQFNQRFDQMGYSSSNWVMNMGSATIFAIIIIGQFFILPCFTRTRLLDCTRFKVLRNLKSKLIDMEQGLYWNEPMRFIIELYFELALICAIRVKTNETSTRSEKILTHSAQAMLALLVVFNYFVAHITVEHKRRWKQHEIASRFGTLYDDFNPSVPGSYYNMSIFLLGRLLFVGALIFLQDYVYAQLAIVTWISLAQCCFAVRMPLEDRLTNGLEIMNQCGSLVVCDLFFQLSDNVPDGETRYFIGWIISGLVVILIAINLIVIGSTMIKELWSGARSRMARRQNARRTSLLRLICKCLNRQEPDTHVRSESHRSAEDYSMRANFDEENIEAHGPNQQTPVLRIRPLPPGRTHNFGQRPQTRGQEHSQLIQLVLGDTPPTVFENSEDGFYDLFDHDQSLVAQDSRRNSSYVSWQIAPQPAEDADVSAILKEMKETEQLVQEMQRRLFEAPERTTEDIDDLIDSEIRRAAENIITVNDGLPTNVSAPPSQRQDEECIYDAADYFSKSYKERHKEQSASEEEQKE